MADRDPSSRSHTADIQDGPHFHFDSSFDTTALIALYRIAEREAHRAPADEFWLSRLAYLQAALNDARRPDVFPILSEYSQRAIDLFISVLDMEVAILTPTPGEEEVRRMTKFMQDEGPGLAAYPLIPTHPDLE